MLNIKKLTYKNFLSSGNHICEINFAENKNTLIIGKNGSGKSTITSALVFALYGKDLRGIVKNNLVNSINKKNLLTTVEFERYGINYKVIRGIKPNIFEIYKDNILLNQDSSVRDQQKWFEEQILQFPFVSFRQMVVLGSGNYIPFMKLTAGQRREFIEELLNLNIFSVMQQRLKDKISENKENKKDIENQLKIIEEKIKIYEKQQLIKSVEIEKEKKDTEEKNIILLKEIDSIDEKNTSFNDKADLINQKIEKIQKLETHYKKVSNAFFYNEKMDKEYKEKKKHFNSLETCPSCLQKIDEYHKKNIIEEFEKKLSENEKQMNENKKEYEKLRQIIDKKSELQNSFFQLQKIISINNNNKMNHMNEISKNNNKLLNLSVKKDEFTEIESEYENKKIFEKKQIDLNDKSNLFDYLGLILKDSGIKSVVIKKYVDILNERINYYLDRFDFYVNFTLDENFSETIKSRHRDEFTYDNFSEGEKMRINLSIILAFRDIARLKNNLNCNIIFFDEIVDGAMDGDGLENLYRILEILDNLSVYVISHRTEAIELFDRVISIKKKNNFSILEKG